MQRLENSSRIPSSGISASVVTRSIATGVLGAGIESAVANLLAAGRLINLCLSFV